ncbi:MAG TPA: GAF domain-containing protein, partial [Polyangiaceae bacterium]|nr:GAF domain-containing protein [Polyangiaceae bacterium]
MTSRISEQNAFLVRVSDAVRGLNDPDAVARTACGLVAAHLGATESHWNEVDWEKRDFVVRDGFHNRDVQSVLTGRHAFASAGPAGAALLSGRSFLIEDARDDARLPSSMREALGERHMVSLLVVPVMVNGALRASLTVTQSAPRRWSTEEVALVEAVAARTWAEIERASAVSALEVELADTRELQRISSSLIERNDTGALYEEILEAARSLMRADFASIQMCAAERNELLLLAHHGFHPESARFWSRVSLDGKSSCALAMHRRELTIVPDVEICEEFAGSDDLDEFRRSGIRAVQSTPLT